MLSPSLSMGEKKLLRVGILLVVLFLVGNSVRAHDDDDHDDDHGHDDDGHDYHHDDDDDGDDDDDDGIGFPSCPEDPPPKSNSASASVTAVLSPDETTSTSAVVTASGAPPTKTPSATRTHTRKASRSRKPSHSRSRTRSRKPSHSRTRTRSWKPSKSRTRTPIPTPFHRWTFDEASGDVAFDVGTARPRYNGLLSYAQRIATSQSGNVVKLSGKDHSFIDISAEVAQFGTRDFSVAFWLQTNDQSRYFELLGNRNAPSHGNFFSMRMTRQGQVCVEVDQDEQGTNYIAITGGSLLNDGQWHHLAAVRKGNTLALYINGVISLQGAASGVANIFNSNPFRIGKTLMGFDLQPPNASYDEVRIYNSALAPTVIKNLARRAPLLSLQSHNANEANN